MGFYVLWIMLAVMAIVVVARQHQKSRCEEWPIDNVF
jgi:hypothetical protein